MTAASSDVRRSARKVGKVAQYKEASDDEESEVSDFEEEEEEEEYTASRKRAKPHKVSSSAKKSKKNRTSKLSKKALDQLETNLTENHLYQSLARPDIDIKDLALEWVESYVEDTENNTNESITTLVNLILRCCGCLHLFQAHDLVNLESAAQTVGELTIAFGNQQNHKYPFKSLPSFKNNVLEFFEELVNLFHEKGLLYKYEEEEQEEIDDEESSLSSPLMTRILTWISSLTSCTIRPLRYISTVVLLTIQNQLCEIIKSVITSLGKTQRQISKIKKIASNKRKIETLNKTIETYHNHKETIIEYFNEIGNVTLGHRYRDIDPLIRQECSRYLSEAMIIYPDHFFQATFLRYFGWLLSDPSHQVRSEVTKVLLKLYKNASNNNNSMGIGFRQFTERYKKQIIKMCSIDNDFNVRHNSISICRELLKIGFLDENEYLEIISIFFQLIDNDDVNLSTANSDKLKLEIAKFINLVNLDNVRNELEKFSIFLENYESSQFGKDSGKLNLNDCLKINDLTRLLQKSLSYYLESKKDSKIKSKYPISSIFKMLYQLHSYANSWEFLIRYLLFDSSSITFTPKHKDFDEENAEITEFKQMLDLSNDSDRLYLLSFINGSLSSLFSNKSKKTKDLEEIASISIKLVNYLPSLQNVSVRSNDQFLIFIRLLHILISSDDDNSNIYTVFRNMGQIEVFNEIIDNLLKFFRNYEVSHIEDDEILNEFDKIFNKLLENYNNSTSINSTGISIINSDIRLKVQNLVQELVAESKDVLTSPVETNDDDNEFDGDLRDQKNLIRVLIDSSKPLLKLRKLTDYMNINEYLNESSSSLSIIELITFKIFNRFDIQPIVHHWSNNFLKVCDNFIQSFKVILDLALVTTSWKLEELIYVPATDGNNLQSNYDIELIFYDTNIIINQTLRILSSYDDAINQINETFGTSSSFSSNDNDKLLVQKLNDLRTLFAAKFIDFITSIKIFYIKFEKNNNFRNFDNIFNDNEGLGKYITRIIPVKVQYQLLNIYLYKEAKLAKILDIELDRNDEEDVNFSNLDDDEIDDEDQAQQRSMFDSEGEASSDDEEDESHSRTKIRAMELKQKQIQQNKIWKAEKELCVFTIKLFALIDLSMVHEFFFNRLKLNSEKIGKVYLRIIKQNEDHLKASPHQIQPKENDNNKPDEETSHVEPVLEIDDTSRSVSRLASE